MQSLKPVLLGVGILELILAAGFFLRQSCARYPSLVSLPRGHSGRRSSTADLDREFRTV